MPSCSLLKLARELYETLLTSLSAATLLGAEKVGVSYDIGDRVVEALHQWTAPLLQRPLEDFASGLLGSIYRDEPIVKGWVDFAIGAACSSVRTIPATPLPFGRRTSVACSHVL